MVAWTDDNRLTMVSSALPWVNTGVAATAVADVGIRSPRRGALIDAVGSVAASPIGPSDTGRPF